MPKKAHTQEQIVAVLRQGEAGEKGGGYFCLAAILRPVIGGSPRRQCSCQHVHRASAIPFSHSSLPSNESPHPQSETSTADSGLTSST